MRNESHSGPEVERLCPRDGGGREETKRKRDRGSFLSCSFLIGVACLILLVHDVNLWIKYTQLQATARAVQPQLLFPCMSPSLVLRDGMEKKAHNHSSCAVNCVSRRESLLFAGGRR